MSQVRVAFAISNQIEINETPLERLSYEGADLIVEFDKQDNERVRLTFSPWQALRVTTIDCYDVRSLLIEGRLHRRVLEFMDSEWISALKGELHYHDYLATFLNDAHHFVLLFQDNVVEIVAQRFECSSP